MQETTYRDAEQLKHLQEFFTGKTEQEVQEKMEERFVELREKGHELSRRIALDAPTIKSISRNAPCPCGSGRKYKRCCLKVK